MNNYIKRLQIEFKDNPDLIIKDIHLNPLHTIYVIFLETLCSQDRINDYILKKITDVKYLSSIESKVPSSNLKIVNKYDEIEFYLYNGYTILINRNKIYAIETKADINRSVSTNETEPAIKGPKNSFIENYQTNLGLIKRRVKNHNLKTKNLSLGRISNNMVGILYIDNIAKKTLVDKVYNKLQNIDVDLINASEDLTKYLSDKTVFPTVIITERPDRCAEALAEGKIVIICDESPNALIVPGFLIDFIHPFSDRYNKYININFTKFLRMLCFFLSIIVPAFYIAIINYNQEAVPTSLIINFAMQREAVPFPSIIECIIMLIICEILRESDLRFPSKYGSAISILGALILGDAAVNAGLVSPIMLIITSFTYISSLLFAEIEFSNALRTYRFIFLILSALFGLYGLMICFIYFIINLCDIKSFDYPYSFPVSPFDKSYFKEFFLSNKNRKRSPDLTNNILKEKS